jgi:hypothetical protein
MSQQTEQQRRVAAMLEETSVLVNRTGLLLTRASTLLHRNPLLAAIILRDLHCLQRNISSNTTRLSTMISVYDAADPGTTTETRQV